MDHSLSTFLCGCAPFHDLVFFAKSLDELDGADEPNSTFLFIDGDKTARFTTSMAWPAIAMATLKLASQGRVVCAIGAAGELWEGTPINASHVHGDIGIGNGSWRSMGVIGNDVYACGMDRVVARRTGTLQWSHLSAPPAIDDKLIVGFESIDGFSTKDIYAVGWQGEIWQRKGARWRQIDSPVSANLNAVCCSEAGVVYAVGDGGVMLKGRDDHWTVLDTGLTENLQDVRDFDGKVYVVTDFDILELANERLQPVAALVGVDDAPDTCLHLLKSADGLVSLGQKDVFKLYAGKWTRVV